MYLFPGSQLAAGLRRVDLIPQRLRGLLIDGFDPVYHEGNGYAQLCQHYDHAEMDIYQYYVSSSAPVQLFAKAEMARWVLGYWGKGEMSSTFYQSEMIQVRSHSVLFFQTKPGKEIRFDLPAGQYSITCCCFTTGYEAILEAFYPVILSPSIRTPLLLERIPFSFQYVWERLLTSNKSPQLLPGFFAAQLRVLLGLTCELYLDRKGANGFAALHPDVDPGIVHKAYQVKKIIESRFGDRLSLVILARASGWNLQGLKSGFLKVFGLSPHQFIIQYRMRVAYDMIQQSEELNIQAIALTCGYKQPHHFIKQFKAFYGKTPGEVRRGR